MSGGVAMTRNAVGFYWTLPVPWAGFTTLPAQIDEAAAVSTTIRYQRDAIRRHAKNEGYELVHEEVFLEIEPDRGSDIIREPLAKVAKICREKDAVLLYVEFSQVQGWRSHAPMQQWSQTSSIQTEPVFPDEMVMDGQMFDPHRHFGAWREKQANWMAGKAVRAAKAHARALVLLSEGRKRPAIADLLNAENISSPSGKPWTADNLGKFLAAWDAKAPTS